MSDNHDPFWVELRARTGAAEQALAEAERRMAEADAEPLPDAKIEQIVKAVTGGRVVQIRPRRVFTAAKWAAAALVVVVVGLAFLHKMADRMPDYRQSPTKAFDDEKTWGILVATDEELLASVRASHPSMSEPELLTRISEERVLAATWTYKRVSSAIDDLGDAVKAGGDLGSQAKQALGMLQNAASSEAIPAAIQEPESLKRLHDHFRDPTWSAARQEILERIAQAARTSILGLRRADSSATDPTLKEQTTGLLKRLGTKLSG